MAKQTHYILLFGVLAFGLLLIGCTPSPDEGAVAPVDDDGGIGVTPVNGEEAAPAAEATYIKACDLLTKQDIASICSKGNDPTLTSEAGISHYDGDDCYFTLNEDPLYPSGRMGLKVIFDKYMRTTDRNVEFVKFEFERSRIDHLHDATEVSGLGDYAFNDRTNSFDTTTNTLTIAKGSNYRLHLSTREVDPPFCTKDEQKALAQLIVSRIR